MNIESGFRSELYPPIAGAFKKLGYRKDMAFVKRTVNFAFSCSGFMSERKETIFINRLRIYSGFLVKRIIVFYNIRFRSSPKQRLPWRPQM